MAEAELREVRPKRPASGYSPRNIFPDAEKYQHPEALDEYLKQRLVALVKADALLITDCLNQPPRIREAVGMIILGQRWTGTVPQRMEINPHDVTPLEVAAYRVKIRSLDGK